MILILIAATGCSIFKRRPGDKAEPVAGARDYNVIVSDVAVNNFTPSGFEIRKGRVEIDFGDLSGKFALYARLNSKGDFYASVRAPLGIEIARLLVVGEDVAAIDRFNRTVYVGKRGEVLGRYGLPEDFFNILFGDMTVMEFAGYRFTGPYELALKTIENDMEREIIVSLGEMKIIRQIISLNRIGSEVMLSFDKFVSAGGIRYGSEIFVSEKKKNYNVKINIEDLKHGYDADIPFELPSYKREKL